MCVNCPGYVRGFLRVRAHFFWRNAPAYRRPYRPWGRRMSAGDPAVGADTRPEVDSEMLAEQQHLDRSQRALTTMRAAGAPDLDYEAALVHRVNVLASSRRPLLFGRIDEATGPTWHIGRRHVEDAVADPLVIDWRAPVAVPFYRAGGG